MLKRALALTIVIGTTLVLPVSSFGQEGFSPAKLKLAEAIRVLPEVQELQAVLDMVMINGTPTDLAPFLGATSEIKFLSDLAFYRGRQLGIHSMGTERHDRIYRTLSHPELTALDQAYSQIGSQLVALLNRTGKIITYKPSQKYYDFFEIGIEGNRFIFSMGGLGDRTLSVRKASPKILPIQLTGTDSLEVNDIILEDAGFTSDSGTYQVWFTPDQPHRSSSDYTFSDDEVFNHLSIKKTRSLPMLQAGQNYVSTRIENLKEDLAREQQKLKLIEQDLGSSH